MSVLSAKSPVAPAQRAMVHPWVVTNNTKNQAQESRLQHILQCIPAGVILLDGWGRVAEANAAAIAMLGEPLLGEAWLEVITRCFRPRSDDGLEVSLADGRRVKLAINALTPESGQLIVLTDLTETRELQNRLSHLQRLSTLGKMMATLAHQIRTPLSSAMLYAENLRSPKLTADARDKFQTKLLARLHDLAQQVNDMLLFARSGTAQAVAKLSLAELATELKNRSEALLAHEQAKLHVQLDTPEALLLGNQTSLVEALLNLLQNSLQAAGQGAQLSLTQHPAATGMLKLCFSDNGPGIAKEIQSQVFEPFFSRKAGGTGLGLAVVQAVITSHQGQIRYLPHAERASGVLAGACFEMVLPLHSTRNHATSVKE